MAHPPTGPTRRTDAPTQGKLICHGLTPRQRLFADEWLSGEGTGKPFNATRAYKFAGYSLSVANPSANPSKLLRHPLVAAYIQKQLSAHAMSAQEVLFRFTEVARSSPAGDVVTTDPSGKNLKLDPKGVIENKRFIKNFGFDAQGQPKIEFHDSQAALQQITRILGMNKDGIDLGIGGGGNVNMVVQFVNPDGTQADLGPTNEVVSEPEDFTDFDEPEQKQLTSEGEDFMSPYMDRREGEDGS